jgi:hypothetical protein
MEDETISLYYFKHRRLYLVLVTIPNTFRVPWKCVCSPDGTDCVVFRIGWNRIGQGINFMYKKLSTVYCSAIFHLQCKVWTKWKLCIIIYIQHVLHDTTTIWVRIAKATSQTANIMSIRYMTISSISWASTYCL